jgi:hypothetical protein
VERECAFLLVITLRDLDKASRLVNGLEAAGHAHLFPSGAHACGRLLLPPLAQELGHADFVVFLASKDIGRLQEVEYYEAFSRANMPGRLGS